MTKRRNFSKAIEELELEELKEKINEGFQEAKDKTEEEIKKNPWAAVGIVAFVFFILGFLLAGRRRD